MASSLRDSLDLIKMVRPEAGTTALDHEIASEGASSLGAAEARVIKALSALADPKVDGEAALDDARDAVWSYFVQRELVGLRKHLDVIQALAIPQEVLAGLGAKPARRP